MGEKKEENSEKEEKEKEQKESSLAFLGSLCEQRLQTVVQTCTPIWLVRRWIKNASCEIDAEDALHVFAIEDRRMRMLIEELIRDRIGDERLSELQDSADALRLAKKQRLSKALGWFTSPNGIIWHVSPSGTVRGLNQDGSRIRDRIEVPKEDGKGIQLGPFILDEEKTCACLHWTHKDESQRVMVWSKDQTLQTRMQLGLSW